MNKDLAILILNYNDYKLTNDCITNMRNNCITNDIFVVDNHSNNESFQCLYDAYKNDNSVEIIKTEENGGYARGNNFGIKHIENKKYKYVCVMNPDIVIKDKSYFENIVEVLRNNDSVAIASGFQIYCQYFGNYLLNYWKLPGKLSGIFDHSFIDFFFKKSQKPISVIDNYAIVDVLSGCCFVAKIDKLREVNYFDENTFLYYEENILSARLKKHNYKEAICLKAYFWHNHILLNKQSLWTLWKNKRTQIKSKLYFYKEYVTSNKLLNLVNFLFSTLDISVWMILTILKKVIKNNK